MKLLQPVNSNDRKVSLSPEKRSPSKLAANFESPSRRFKPRNTRPIRISPSRSSSPQTLASIQKEEPKPEIGYTRYRDRISWLDGVQTRTEVSSKKISPRESRRISPKDSPRNSRYPSLKKEIPDYRTESGYRTIKTSDPPVRTPEKGSKIRVFNEESQSPSRRSKSPRFKSDLTDYRIGSNLRTIKTYDEPARQSAYSNLLTSSSRHGLSDTNEQQPRKKKLPSLRQEPTTYREETNYRTVKVFDYPPSQVRESRETERPWRETEKIRREPQSEIKKPEEKPEDKKNKVEVSKKLEFEQKESKPYKQEPPGDYKTPSKEGLKDEKSNEMSFKKSANFDSAEVQRYSPTATGSFHDTSDKKSHLKSYDE